MNTFAASFAGLVKSNNGLFKSEKQAAFLLSQCQEENTYYCAGNVYGNSFQLTYTCDSKGVIKVEKYLPKTGKLETLFIRTQVGEHNPVEAAKVEKEQNRLKREIKALEKKLEQREVSWLAGNYTGTESLYHESKAADIAALQAYKTKLDN